MRFLTEIIKKITDFNYKRVLKKISAKDIINVVFLVSENQKWSYESVWHELKNSGKFNLKILITYSKDLKLTKKEKEEFLRENYNFYSKIDENAEFIHKNNKNISLKKFKPDIVFYEQQWGLVRKYKPYFVSFYALAYFSCYGVQLFDFREDYSDTFHYFLYKYLVDFKENFLRFKKYNKNYIKNCIVTGYPKLDRYIDIKKAKSPKKPKVIWAPHHSLFSGLNTSTFLDYHEFILKLARETKEDIYWIFKPHPRLKKSLLENNVMTKNEIGSYYNAWVELGEVFDCGNYLELFVNSDILITDCCSFLGEYYYTNNPVIRLINKNAVPLNELGINITKNYFCVHDTAELKKVFFDIILNCKNNFKIKQNNLKNIKKSSGIILKSILKDIVRGRAEIQNRK